jgi:hypothetical protein
MAKFKDFGGAGKRKKKTEPISFKLYEEEFHCVSEIQGQVLLEFAAKSSSDDPGSSASIIADFFGSVLTDESYKRFSVLVKDKEKVVPVETLAEITSWLMEAYTERPNQQPED